MEICALSRIRFAKSSTSCRTIRLSTPGMAPRRRLASRRKTIPSFPRTEGGQLLWCHEWPAIDKQASPFRREGEIRLFRHVALGQLQRSKALGSHLDAAIVVEVAAKNA